MSMVPECFSTSETVRKFFLKKASDSTDSKSKKSSGLSGFLPVLSQHTENIYLFYTPFSISHNYTSVFYRAILPRCIPHHRTIFKEMVLTRH